MKKIFLGLLCILFIVGNVMAANQWQNDTGEDIPLGNTSVSDIDTVLFQRGFDPADRLLDNYRENAKISYLSASSMSVAAGEVTCSNTAGTIKRWRQNTSATTVTWSDIDTGSEAANTTYFLFASCDADATTFVVKISTNATTPSGVTYYRRLGQFYNNSSSNILNDETVINDNDYYSIQLGDWVSKTVGTIYLASTDGFAVAWRYENTTDFLIHGYTDSNSSPSTERAHYTNYSDPAGGSITMPVKKGDYWKVIGADTLYWLPLE